MTKKIPVDAFMFAQQPPPIIYATNTFINVPIIFQYHDTPLIELTKVPTVGFTHKVNIFNQDGVKIAVAKGSKFYFTPEGEKSNLTKRHFPDHWVAELNGKPIFELKRTAKAWEVDSELYAPDGTFLVARHGMAPQYFNNAGGPLKLKGLTMSGSVVEGYRVGVWLKSDGSISIGNS